MYNHNYGDDRNRSYPNVPFQQPAQGRGTERLWVEISDDDDSICNAPSVFKSSDSKGQSQPTPPLDLSVLETKGTKGSRQVESPLDLSVKTRKRCADTTDFDNMSLRQGQHIGHGGQVRILDQPLTKRMRITPGEDRLQSDSVRSQRNPQTEQFLQQQQQQHHQHLQEQQQQQRLVQNQIDYEQGRQIIQDSSSTKQASMQKLALQSSNRKYSNVSQGSSAHPLASPLSTSLPQQQHQHLQQYQTMQKQHHLSQQNRQVPIQQGHTQTQAQFQTQRHIHPYSENQRSKTQIKPKTIYDPIFQTSVPRPIQSNASETVALQGFFEPTQKVTVNAGVIGAYPKQVPVRNELDQSIRSNKSIYQSDRPRERLSPAEQRNNPTLVRGSTFPMGSSVRMPRSDTHPIVSQVPELEHLQQRQIEHQRQLQLANRAKKEQSFLAQMEVAQKNAIMMNSPENQRMPQNVDIRNMSESSYVQLQKHQSPLSPFSPVLRDTYTSSASHGSIRNDHKMYSNNTSFIRASQPFSLSDLQIRQSNIITEKSPDIIVHPNVYAQHNNIDANNMSLNRKIMEQSHHEQQTNRAQNSHSQSLDRERRYRMPENMERPSPLDRNNVGSIERKIHPSVIQRPQGFIPPRIVSGAGGGRSSGPNINIDPAQRALENMPQRSRYGSLERGLDPIESGHVFNEGSQIKRTADMLPPSLQGHKSRGVHIQDSIQINRMSGQRQQASLDNKRSQLPVNVVKQRGRPRLSDSQRANAINSRGALQRQMPRISPQSHNVRTDTIINKELNGPLKEAHVIDVQKTSKPSPMVVSVPSERSITKGTSGNTKTSDFFERLVMKELKKTDDSVNPFADRSLLQEFDRSANSSPIRHKKNENKSIVSVPIDKKSIESICREPVSSQNKTDDESSSYTLPLQIAIPGNKSGTSQPSSVVRTSVISSAKPENTTVKNPKIMSRKHMILNAFKHDEEIKKTVVNIDQDVKVPLEKAKLATKRTEKESGGPNCPPSPKMPILSPQEKNRATPLVSPLIGGPPPLENNDGPRPQAIPKQIGETKCNSEMFSIEERLHKIISDAVKCSANKDKESVYETVCRELHTQPQGNKVFLTRQQSLTKNIPVANVAPIIHGKQKDDTSGEQTKSKYDDDLDEEEEKMAAVITRSLLGQTYDRHQEKLNDNKVNSSLKTEMEVESNVDSPNASVQLSQSDSNTFDDNSNSMRMSPGIKKLMLYRHRDIAETSKDDSDITDREDTKTDSNAERHTEGESSQSTDRHLERNVFGSFNEILAQSIGDNIETGPCWSGIADVQEHQIHMVPNCDYDGDEEDNREHNKVRRNKTSSIKQQADKLIKKARHRRNSKSEGCLLDRFREARDSRLRLSKRRHSNKGFVDFMPQVLPRRTRSRITGKSPQRRKSSSSKYDTRSDTHNTENGRGTKENDKVKSRQRRSSSLDRETKRKKAKSSRLLSYHSDNEIDSNTTIASSIAATWDEENNVSTDEEYFQNYEDDFKEFNANTDSNQAIKKSASVKKKKGFHFKQKYIFQRKRKSKGRGKTLDVDVRAGGTLDELYSFHEDSLDILPYPRESDLSDLHSNVPVPPEVKRVTVNKDTGETLLHRAAKMGQEEVALYCLATGTVDVNARDNAGYTALHECAVRGKIEIAKHLLKHGADVNCCSVDGIRPIHDAVENDQLEILRLLLSFGADPTLSTYAGRTLTKIARTERMRNYLQAYINDLNGYNSDEESIPWQYKASSTLFEPEDNYGCAIFNDVASDPEDESADMCILSSKPFFPTHRLSMEPGKLVEDYILIDDILNSYHVTRGDLDIQGLPSHLIKSIPIHRLLSTRTDSIYQELFLGQTDIDSVAAVRTVDSTQIITKLEKHSHSHGSSKRAKS